MRYRLHLFNPVDKNPPKIAIYFLDRNVDVLFKRYLVDGIEVSQNTHTGIQQIAKIQKIFAWVQEEVLPTSARVRQICSPSGCVSQHD